MKYLNGTCRYCGKILTLEVEEGYDAVSDPFKLVPLAACNRCARLRVARRVLNDRFSKLIAILRVEKNSAVLSELRKGLEELSKAYVKMVSDWTNQPNLAWDETIVEAIMQNPDTTGEVLRRIWPDKQQQDLGITA